MISTYCRRPTLPESVCVEMYKVISSLVERCNAKLLRINGIENHIHILVDFGPKTCRQDLLKTIKQNSSLWARHSGKFPLWEGWGREYYCFSVSSDRKSSVCAYIENQKEHHKKTSFENEMKRFVAHAGMEWNENLPYD
ncbi:MAG: transposase [Muribaculaceae bacterium]|nr:transposase [Muribaculaceae bacterium]